MFPVGPPAHLATVQYPSSSVSVPGSTSYTPGPVSASCSLMTNTHWTPVCLPLMRSHEVSFRNKKGIPPDFPMCRPVTGDMKCQRHNHPPPLLIPHLSFSFHAFVSDLRSGGRGMAFHDCSGQNPQQEEAGTGPVEKAPGQLWDSWRSSQVVGGRKASCRFASWLTGGCVFLGFQRTACFSTP